MSHALRTKGVELNMGLDKAIADIQFRIDEVKQDVIKRLDEFNKAQAVQTERMEKIEDSFETEIQNLKDLFADLNQKFESFQLKTSMTIDHDQGLKDWEQIKEQIAQLSKISPAKLREELIGGIRMLGERVTKAITDINERIDNFTDEIQAQINNVKRSSFNDTEAASGQEGDNFAPLKESKLLDINDFEVVPRQAIKQLTELFKKQSAAVKSHIENHEQKMQQFEQILKTYDEENTRLLELLDRRVKRNFLISMVVITIVILCSIALLIF